MGPLLVASLGPVTYTKQVALVQAMHGLWGIEQQPGNVHAIHIGKLVQERPIQQAAPGALVQTTCNLIHETKRGTDRAELERAENGACATHRDYGQCVSQQAAQQIVSKHARSGAYSSVHVHVLFRTETVTQAQSSNATTTNIWS